MYLLFDLSPDSAIHLALFSEHNVRETVVVGRNRELLPVLDVFLQAEQCPKTTVQGIMVVVGAGRFTSTRIATTVANTWAYIYSIPLLGIAAADIPRIQALIPTLEQQPHGTYLSATYSAMPRLGTRS